MDVSYYRGLEQRARDVREAGPNFEPDLARRTHAGQRPPIWLAAVLLVLSLGVAATVFIGLNMWRARLGLGEMTPHQALLPQNRLDKVVTAVTLETRSSGQSGRVLAADAHTVHYGEPFKELLYWRHWPVKELCPAISKPIVTGLSASEGRVAAVYEQEGDPRRGVHLASLPQGLHDLVSWTRPAIDTSCFPEIDDDTASCLAWDPNAGRRFIGGPGVGVYDVIQRRWEGTLTRAGGEIGSDSVRDLEFVRRDLLAVAGDRGIDLGRWTAGRWAKTCQIDKKSGLAGDNVSIVHAAASDPSSGAADLVYLTAGRGMGRLSLDLEDGTVQGTQRFVAEGRAEGLSRQSLRCLAEDHARDALWMIYQDPHASEKVRAALYEVPGHQMTAMNPAESWVQSDPLTLGVDSYAGDPTVWVGGNGLRRVHATPGGFLEAAEIGLQNSVVQEIAPASAAVFAKTRDGTGTHSSACVYGALREDISRVGKDAWQYCVGPRRLPGLELEDLTAATDGILEGQSALLFGTRDKGIAAFLRGTRELVRAFDSPGQEAPARGVLDLCAAGPCLVQVGSDRSLHSYDGTSWSNLIPPGGIQLDPRDVVTVVACGPDLILGSAQRIVHYSALTHRWKTIPPIEGLQRLILAIDRIWAVDSESTLYSCAWAEALGDLPQAGGPSSSAPRPGAAPGAGVPVSNLWVQEETFVKDVYGDSERIMVLAEESLGSRLWTKTRRTRERTVIVQTMALPGDGHAWTTAAVDGTRLYVAPHAGGIGQYDLTNHKWTRVPFPSGTRMVRSLMVTRTGLWLLDGNNTLSYQAKDSDTWVPVVDKVVRANSGRGVVMVLTIAGHVLMSDVFTGGLPMRKLVGDGLREPLASVQAGTVLNGRLFVATPGGVGQYDPLTHSWRNYDAGAPSNVVEFASGVNRLFARSSTGKLWRSTPDSNEWEPVLAAGQEMRVRQIVGDNGPSPAALDTEGRLLALPDKSNDSPAVVLAASLCPIRAPFAAAAEVDGDLLVASAHGGVAAYSKAASNPWKWMPVTDSGEQIRQLLSCGRRNDRAVAVGDGKILLLAKSGPNDNWYTVRTLMEADGRIRGAAADSDFYGLVWKGQGDAVLWKAAIPSDTTPSADPPALPVTIIGSQFPAGPRPETVAVAVDETGGLFRTDGSGVTAMYSFTAHNWTAEPIQRVARFFRVGGRLWAWCPSTGQLYQRVANEWQEDDRRWAHVAGRDGTILLIDSHGQVVLRTVQGDRTLIPALVDDLPITGFDTVVAFAEHDGSLFLATRDGAVFSYDRMDHRWQRSPGATGVARFERLDTGGVFAVTRAGTLLHLDDASQQWTDTLPTRTTAAAVRCTGDRIAVVTTENHVLLLDGGGQIVATHRPGIVQGHDLGAFEIVAAAEQDGQLLLLPQSDDDEGQMWAYDPRGYSWATCRLQGRTDRFYHARNGLWVATRETDGSMRLGRVEVTPTLRVGTSVGGLLDASCDGQAVVVVTGDGRIRQLESDGQLTDLGIAEASLPKGQTVRDARGSDNACIVLLDDGSVYHYTLQTRRWDCQIPPVASGGSGRFVDIGRRQAVLLVRPDTDLWVCDTRTATWTKLKPDEGVSLEGTTPEATHGVEVTGQAPDYVFTVVVEGRRFTMPLRDGRLSLDVADHVALEAGTLHVNTAVGVRTFRSQSSQWIEDDAIGSTFSYAKPEPVSLEGESFAVRRESGGPFQAIGGAVAIRLKTLPGMPQLLPVTGTKGFGFAHDVIRDVAGQKGRLFVVTAGGVALMSVDGASLRMEELHEMSCGIADPNLVRILADAGGLLAESRRGECYQYLGGRTWTAIDRGLMREAAMRASAITRCNAMLSHWRVRLGDGGVEFDAVIDAKQVPVSLSPRGFGFDQPRAFGFAGQGLRLYTPDGTVTIGPSGSALNLPDPVFKLSVSVSTAEALESLQGEDVKNVWLRSISSPGQVWLFDGKGWVPSSTGDYDKMLSELRPHHWKSTDIEWDRQDRVVLRGKVPNIPAVTIRFDPVCGRFETDLACDLAVFKNDLWATTKSGIVRFRPDGSWDHLVQVDPSVVASLDKWRLRVVAMDRYVRLVAQWPTGALEWDGKSWGPSADPNALREAIALLDAHVLYGTTWRVESQVRSGSVPMQARLVANHSFADVRLRNDGRFDFECINSILAMGNDFHVATEFGLLQVDLNRREIVTLAPQASPVVALGQFDGRPFARLASGQTLCRAQQWELYGGADDVFTRIRNRVVKASPWQLDRDGARLQVQLLPGPTSPWSGTAPLLVAVRQGRFDFDTVHDLGYADFPWLVTDTGLVPRLGPNLDRIGEPQRIGDGAVDRMRLSYVTYDQEPRLILQEPKGLHICLGNAWQPVPAARTREVENALATEVTSGSHFAVSRAVGRGLEMRLRVEGPAGQYKRIEFDSAKGLFTFDMLASVCPCLEHPDALALAATGGGVAVYGESSASVDPNRGIGLLCHLYCDLPSDGLETAKFDRVLHVQNLSLAVSASGDLYQLRDDNAGFGQWTPANETGRAIYDYCQHVIADDASAWQVTDGGQVTRGVNASGRFRTRWRRQLVRLINLQETRDAPQPLYRFAHDVPLSATLTDGALWLGTRGGVVVYATDDSHHVDQTKCYIRGDQTLPVAELVGDHSSKGVGFVRAGGDSRVYAHREGDGAVICCEARDLGQDWRQIPATDKGFLSACRVAEDPIWRWVKDSVGPVRLEPNRDRLRIPAGYQFLRNGTWAFLEADRVVAQQPRHTMVSFRNHLFYVTAAGGITDLGDASSLAVRAGDRIDMDVYATAESRTGPVPLTEVTSLYVDPSEDRLYAQARNQRCYVFDPGPGRKVWSVWEDKSNPADRVLVVVDNELLRGRVTSQGRYELTVTPLDLTDQSNYPLFCDGRFMFDEVREFVATPSQLWLATDGGVCAYAYPDFRPIRFWGRAFSETQQTHAVGSQDSLPKVREVVCDPDGARTSRILCRTASGDRYAWDGTLWSRCTDDGPFERTYTRQTDTLTQWLEYPQRQLEVRVKTASGQVLTLGSKGDKTRPDLFRNHRFSFDDVRGAVLHGSVLLTATNLGVIEQVIDWSRQHMDIKALYRYAEAGASLQEMSGLDRIRELPGGRVLTWGRASFVRNAFAGPTGAWRVYEHPAKEIGPQMILDDGSEQWKIVACASPEPMRVGRLSDGSTRPITARFQCCDVSNAVMDDRWIYVPVPEPQGGLLRISKDKVNEE